MLIYVLSYITITLSFLFFSFSNISFKRKRIWLNVICFTILLLIFSLRKETMGVDLGGHNGYLYSFDYLNELSWNEIFHMKKYLNYEYGFILFNKFIGSIYNNHQFYLFACALLTLMPISIAIYKLSSDIYFSYIIYMGLPLFLLPFSGLRQSIGIGFCFYALVFIKEKKFIKFILTILVASLFHYTSIIFIIAYFAYNIKLTKTFRYFTILLIPICYIFRVPLFNIIANIFKNNPNIDNNDSINLFLIYSGIYIFCVIFSNNDKSQNGLMNLFFIGVIGQSMAGLNSVVSRAGYYFIISLVILLPNVINQNKGNEQKYIFKYSILIVFILYGLYSLKNGSWAESFPYSFFWE